MFLLILCLFAPFYSIILISGNMDWTLKIDSSGVSWSVLCHFTVCRYNVCLSAKQLSLEGFCCSACREGDRWGQWMGEVRTSRAAEEGGVKEVRQREIMCLFPLLPSFMSGLKILSFYRHRSALYSFCLPTFFSSSLPFPALNVKARLWTFMRGFRCSRDGASSCFGLF